MEKNPKKLSLQRFMMNPEEIEAYTEPSIMDEYIRKNDPEQWNNIVRAKNLKFAQDLAMGQGAPFALIGAAAKNTSKELLKRKFFEELKSLKNQENIENILKTADKRTIENMLEQYSLNPEYLKQLIRQDQASRVAKISKGTPSSSPDYEKVLQKEQPTEKIGSVTGDVSSERPLTLQERVEKMIKTEAEDPKFVRLREYIKKKKEEK